MSLSFEDQHKLDEFWSYCVKHQYFNIGYPESADFNYTVPERFMRFPSTTVVTGLITVITG